MWGVKSGEGYWEAQGGAAGLEDGHRARVRRRAVGRPGSPEACAMYSKAVQWAVSHPAHPTAPGLADSRSSPGWGSQRESCRSEG